MIKRLVLGIALTAAVLEGQLVTPQVGGLEIYRTAATLPITLTPVQHAGSEKVEIGFPTSLGGLIPSVNAQYHLGSNDRLFASVNSVDYVAGGSGFSGQLTFFHAIGGDVTIGAFDTGSGIVLSVDSDLIPSGGGVLGTVTRRWGLFATSIEASGPIATNTIADFSGGDIDINANVTISGNLEINGVGGLDINGPLLTSGGLVANSIDAFFGSPDINVGDDLDVSGEVDASAGFAVSGDNGITNSSCNAPFSVKGGIVTGCS